MFHLGTAPWELAVRTLVVYFVVLFGLRFFGKRQLGQMNVADLVMILLIANAVQNAMVGPDVSLVGGLIAAVTLLIVNFFVTRALSRSREAQKLLEGSPTLLVKDGRFVLPGLAQEGVSQEEVEMAIREHGIASVASVRLAYLEPDGTISVVPLTSQVLRGRRRVRQIKKH